MSATAAAGGVGAAALPIIYLFGLPGAGKNYVGEVLRDVWGLEFADADEWLLQDMRESLARKEGFTPEQCEPRTDPPPPALPDPRPPPPCTLT